MTCVVKASSKSFQDVGPVLGMKLYSVKEGCFWRSVAQEEILGAEEKRAEGTGTPEQVLGWSSIRSSTFSPPARGYGLFPASWFLTEACFANGLGSHS